MVSPNDFTDRAFKMVSPNDFTDRASYYVQCAIIRAIGQIRDSAGRSPYDARRFLFKTMKYNNNSGNEVRELIHPEYLCSRESLVL